MSEVGYIFDYWVDDDADWYICDSRAQAERAYADHMLWVVSTYEDEEVYPAVCLRVWEVDAATLEACREWMDSDDVDPDADPWWGQDAPSEDRKTLLAAAARRMGFTDWREQQHDDGWKEYVPN